MTKVFIVEDDAAIAAALEKHLTRRGFEARRAGDLRNVADECAAYAPQLVLLDVSLPYFDGFAWCARIRASSSVPIVFLSAAADNMNVLMALSLGGDDFIAKPFDFDVLTAKMQAVLRRSGSSKQSAVLTRGPLSLDVGDATLRAGENKIELTRNEMRMLRLLMENAGHAVRRETLMERLWETNEYIDDNTLTVNMARLRKKLEDAGYPGLIVTRKGVGYQML